MTNTKFRKRALLSSVAMLLVALVALGSATFAWFTENPKVDADGITAQAQTSTGLLIKTTTDAAAWVDSADFMKDGNTGLKLIPAYAMQRSTTSGETTTYSIDWLSTKAGDANDSTPATGAVWASENAATSFVEAVDGNAADGTGIYHEQALIKVKNGAASNINLTGVAITGTGALDIKNGVTVLVAVSGEIKKVVKLGSRDILNYADATSASGSNTVGTASGTYLTGKVAKSGSWTGTQLLGEAGDGDATALVVDVYVYLDGTDDDVKTNNAIAGDLISNIKLDFAKA